MYRIVPRLSKDKNQVSQQSKDLNATIAESQLNVAQAGQVGGQNQVIKDGEQITNSSEINASQQNYPAQKSKDLSVAVDKYTQQKGILQIKQIPKKCLIT